MLETIFNSVEKTVKNNLELINKVFEFKLPGLMPQQKEISDAALEARAEAAAHSACKFFDMPDAQIKKGDSIGVYKKDIGKLNDDVFQYNLSQFKKMNCTSFEDMTKVWAHECGHRILQNHFPSSWANELGSDFFSGARSEMLGLPKSNFEQRLGATQPSKSHPGGSLRLQAMDYGRFVVNQMKKAGIQPTWENCLEVFKNSQFAKMSYSDYKEGKTSGLVDNKAYHYGNAANAQAKVNWNLKRSESAASRGDYKLARDYARTASRWQTTVRDETRAAGRCSKLIDGQTEGLDAFVDNKSYHYGNAANAQSKVNWNLKQSKSAASRGDYKLARDYARTASRWQTTVKDETRAAQRSTK